MTNSWIMRGIRVAAVVAASGAAFCAEPPKEEGFEQPLGARGAQGSSTLIINETDASGRRYSLRVQDGKATAEVDGQAVGKDRLRKRGTRYEILDAEGGVMKAFEVGASPFQVNIGQGGLDRLPEEQRRQIERLMQQAPGAQGEGLMRALRDAEFAAQAATPPKVMLGITMSDSDDDPGVIIDTVLPGLPAEKAGLKPGDRIVKLNDATIAEGKDLREFLRERKAGDEVKARVVREGDEKEFTLALESYDRSKLPASAWRTPVAVGVAGEPAQSWFDESLERIEKAIAELRKAEIDKKVRAKAEAALEAAKADLERAKAEAVDQWGQAFSNARNRMNAWRWAEGAGGQPLVRLGRPDEVIVVPQPPTPPGEGDDGLSKKLEKLAGQLDRMEKLAAQMDRLDKRLDEMEKRLERRER